MSWMRKSILVAAVVIFAAALLPAEQLKVANGDPLVYQDGWYYVGGRFNATLDNVSVYLFCSDFNHVFYWNRGYTVNLTPIYGDIQHRTYYGPVADNDWQIYNDWPIYNYTAVQRYMMAAWLTTQYAPFFAHWEDDENKKQAAGIQTAIWWLLLPQNHDYSGWKTPYVGDYTDTWLRKATDAIAQDDLNDPTDPFYRYFRIVSPLNPDYKDTLQVPQEFIVQVTPEPATLLLLGGMLIWVGLGMERRRRGRSKEQ